MRNILITTIMVTLISADLLKPENNASLNQIYIMFEWGQEAEAQLYHFELSDNDSFTNPIVSNISKVSNVSKISNVSNISKI